MRLGLYAPVSHATPRYGGLVDYPDRSRHGLSPGVADPAFVLARDVVLAAERRGFDIALFAERHLGPDLECWITAAAVAGQTSTIRVMPALNPDYWHPAVAAKMALSLDRISPGRSAINFVTGQFPAEQAAFSSVRHGSDEEKYRRAGEFVATMHALWRGGPVSQDGYFPLETIDVGLVPAATPPPIYMVGRSDRGLDLAARCADYWFVDYGTETQLPFEELLDRMRNAMAQMRGLAERHGRQIGFVTNALVLYAASETEAFARAESLRADDRDVYAPVRWGGTAVGLLGPNDLLQERLGRLAEIGLDMVLCRMLPHVDELEAVADALGAALSPPSSTIPSIA